MPETEENKIVLVQKPVIKHELQKIGEGVTARLARLNLDKLIANEDSVKTLKQLRAELNKEFSEYELQRKMIKTAIANPYKSFEEEYNEQISEKYKEAVEILKDKISLVETKVKQEKKENIESFFNELCLAEKIDFISFDQLDLNINLSTSPKSLKDKCRAFISKVNDEVEMIRTMEYEIEMMAEYKISLNVSQAIRDVQQRKQRERDERVRKEEAELLRRTKCLIGMGLQFDEETNTYVFSDVIYVSLDNIKYISKEEFQNKVLELEEEIKEEEIARIKDTIIEPIKESSNTGCNQPLDKLDTSNPPKAIKKPEPLPEPTVVKKPELATGSFKVTDTLKKVKSVGQFMRDNNINYKNI